MDIRSAQFMVQLLASARHESTKTAGSVNIGQGSTTVDLSTLMDANAGVAYAVKFVIGVSGVATLDLATGATTGPAGTASVETATAVGTSNATPNAQVTATISDSPHTAANKVVTATLPLIAMAAADWAAVVRAALTADTDVSAVYTVSGTGADIVITDKTTNTAPSLNIALANGSPTAGITAAPTSTTSVAGVGGVTSITDGDGKDFEGVDIPTLVSLYGLMLIVSGDVYADIDTGTIFYVPISGTTTSPSYLMLGGATGPASLLSDPLTLTAQSPSTTVTAIVFGASA